MVANQTNQILDEIIRYCDIILDILSDWRADNDTPPGRIILECIWLKQEISRNNLIIPDAYQEITSIRHSYVDSDLPPETEPQRIYDYLGYIVSLTKGKLILKPENYPIAVSELDGLIALLKKPPRRLNPNETSLVSELQEIRRRLTEIDTTVPLPDQDPAFKNFWDVYDYDESSIDDIPNAHTHLDRIAKMVFEAQLVQ